MKILLKILTLLLVFVAMSSCHAPKVDAVSSYEVKIFPDIFQLRHNNYYTFYAVLTPKSNCSNVGEYHWKLGGQLYYQDSGSITVKEAQEKIGSVYEIPEDSYCSFCTIKAQTYSIGTLATSISYCGNSTNIPYATQYLKVTY